jgi:hypothetical protein
MLVLHAYIVPSLVVHLRWMLKAEQNRTGFIARERIE